MQLSSASLHFVDETRAELDLWVHVRNDQERPLLISALRFWLELDGHPFAAGVQALSSTVPGREGAELKVVLPLHFRRRPLSAQPRDVVLGVRGKVAVGEGAGALLIPFSGQRLQALARAPVWDADEE